jgi:MFS family permease
MQFYQWVVYLHVLGAFLFFIAHGTSMMAAFRLRAGVDRARASELLELSGQSIGLMYIGLLVLLAAGILAGFMGDHWGRGWIWAAIGVLVVVLAAMYAIATPFYSRMRVAAALPDQAEQAAKFKPPATREDLDALATSNRPIWLAIIGLAGLAVILWLMILKPF